MKIKLIRNATLRLEYGGRQFLIDPYLGDKHSQPSWIGISPNPTVGLPITPEEILADVNQVLVSHLHPDHFDDAAERMLPKNIPLICQPEEQAQLQDKGFTNTIPLISAYQSGGTIITRIPGQHGFGERLEMMGPVSGFMFQHQNEPTLYWMGDTVWHEGLMQFFEKYQPNVVVTHSCGAIWGKGEEPVVLDAEQTVIMCRMFPDTTFVATHMEAIELAVISRQQLRNYADTHGISRQQLSIPNDGDVLLFSNADIRNVRADRAPSEPGNLII